MAIKHAQHVFFGKTNLVDGNLFYVEVTDGVFYRVGHDCVVRLRMKRKKLAKKALQSMAQLKAILRLIGTAPVIVTSAALPDIKSGLKILGCGGGGVHSIMNIATAPASLSEASLASLSAKLGSGTTTTHQVTISTALGGAVLGIAGTAASAVAYIVEAAGAGAVETLPGSGIASATQASASFAACLGGASIAGGAVFAVWAFCEREIHNNYLKRMRRWESGGATMPVGTW